MGHSRSPTQIPNSVTPSKNATDIKPAAFSVNGDEENRTLDLLHAMQAHHPLYQRLKAAIDDSEGLVRTPLDSKQVSERVRIHYGHPLPNCCKNADTSKKLSTPSSVKSARQAGSLDP